MYTLKLYPHPVLREKCKKVEKVGEEEKEILKALARIMKEEGGVGLSAPQIGVPRRLIVVEKEGGILKVVNPEIVKREGAIFSEEGCLSLPGTKLRVPRSEKIEIEGLDEEGSPFFLSATGLLSRTFQHEVDHLEGRLIIDYLPPSERKKVEILLRGREVY